MATSSKKKVSSLIEVENPMVIDSLWKDKEKEPKVIGECSGCQEDIYSTDYWYEYQDGDEDIIVHQKADCCWQFVSARSVCRGPQEIE